MTDPLPGYRHVEPVMGTAVSIDVRDETGGEAPGLRELVTWLHHVDGTFSTYKADSPISRLGRGELDLADTSEEVRGVLRRCEELRAETTGAFDAFAVVGPDGPKLDPSGYVKGWAIGSGAAILKSRGLTNFCINAGGDVVVDGAPRPDRVWRIGIRHPDDAHLLAAVLEASGPMAIATSATYERGAHITDPRVGAPATSVASVTVVGPDLADADAYATAVFVMAVGGLEWLAARRGYEGLVITHDGQQLSTPGFAEFRADPSRE